MTTTREAAAAAIAAARCKECTLAGRRGTCAPLRCYCGHPTCPAFASYVPRRELSDRAIVGTPSTPTPRTTWDDRDEATWIDKM